MSTIIVTLNIKSIREKNKLFSWNLRNKETNVQNSKKKKEKEKEDKEEKKWTVYLFTSRK